MPGKRKRDAAVVSRKADETTEQAGFEIDETDTQNIFRKYFEAKFEPLPEREPQPPSPSTDDEDKDEDEDEDEDEDDDNDDGSEWDGILGDDGVATEVKIIEHRTVSDVKGETLDKSVSRRFMVRTSTPDLLMPLTNPLERAPNPPNQETQARESAKSQINRKTTYPSL